MKKVVFAITISALLLFLATAVLADTHGDCSLTWYGQAFFTVTDSHGLTVAFDPYHIEKGINYSPPKVSASAVFISHEHFDHNNLDLIDRRSDRVFGPLTKDETRSGMLELYNTGTIGYRSVFSSHDAVQGKERGTNTINVVDVDGVTVCHMGDIGVPLTETQIARIGRVDILLVPVGGVYTVDAAGATKIVDQLKPKVVIPMHYKTPKISLPLQGVEPFLQGKKVVRGGDTFWFTKYNLPKPTTVRVMAYKSS